MPPPSTRRLQNILHRTASAGVSGNGSVRTEASEDALFFVLSRIESCILPRRLTIVVNNTKTLTLDVANGKILRLHEVVGLSEDLCRVNMNQALRPSDAEVLYNILEDLCQQSTSVHSQEQPLSDVPEEMNIGITLRDLGLELQYDDASQDLSDMVGTMQLCAILDPDEGWTIQEDETPELNNALDYCDSLFSDYSQLAEELTMFGQISVSMSSGLIVVLNNRDYGLSASVHRPRLGSETQTP